LGTAGGDDHEVGEIGLAGEIDDHWVDRLVVGERRFDEVQEVVAGRSGGRFSAYGPSSFRRTRRPDAELLWRSAVLDAWWRRSRR
jgi:hypothetical protein